MQDSYPILIVEDNPVSRKLLEKTLKKGGYEVVSVSTGEEALTLFRCKFFPIVITDWMMPGMDGLELCRQIRTMDLPGYVFIILLTAKDSKDDLIAGLEAGADDYLTKPLNYPELKARLKSGFRILELEKSLKKANEEIRILSITDSLTGCYNRHFLMQRLRHEIKRARRYKHELSVVM
ncbi:MAG: diguanylate cyclase response regulator, partial [Deltaproteobacteria bacterium]